MFFQILAGNIKNIPFICDISIDKRLMYFPFIYQQDVVGFQPLAFYLNMIFHIPFDETDQFMKIMVVVGILARAVVF